MTWRKALVCLLPDVYLIIGILSNLSDQNARQIKNNLLVSVSKRDMDYVTMSIYFLIVSWWCIFKLLNMVCLCYSVYNVFVRRINLSNENNLLLSIKHCVKMCVCSVYFLNEPCDNQPYFFNWRPIIFIIRIIFLFNSSEIIIWFSKSSNFISFRLVDVWREP